MMRGVDFCGRDSFVDVTRVTSMICSFPFSCRGWPGSMEEDDGVAEFPRGVRRTEGGLELRRRTLQPTRTLHATRSLRGRLLRHEAATRPESTALPAGS